MRPQLAMSGRQRWPAHPRLRLCQHRHGVHARQRRQPREEPLTRAQHAAAAHVGEHEQRWPVWWQQREAARGAELVRMPACLLNPQILRSAQWLRCGSLIVDMHFLDGTLVFAGMGWRVIPA